MLFEAFFVEYVSQHPREMSYFASRVRVVTRDMGSGITGLGLGIAALPWDQGLKFRKS